MNNMITHLQNLYAERCKNNEQYSLRAFARNLNIPVSTLSEILSGKRPLTKRLRDKIGFALDIPKGELLTFSAKEHGNVKTKSELPAHYQELALDSFYIISDWYHYGILQLMRTKGFKNDPKWIAKRLGIQVLQVKHALQRLKRVGILEEENGELIDTTQGSTTHLKNNFTSDELRGFQIRALEKAITSLKTVPVSLRDNTSMTMAISKEAIPFAKEEITKFRRSLTKKLEAYGEPDEVYQLAISLTPLTELN